MTGELNSADFGFWKSIRKFKWQQVFLAWDFLVALLIAVGGTWLYVTNVCDIEQHRAVVADFVSVGGALFGVVLAGFAIVAAFLGERYGRLVKRAGASPTKMLQHFLFVSGLLMASLVLCIGYRAGAVELYEWHEVAEPLVFGLCALSFLWPLFSVLELTKLVLAIAITSVEQPPED